jgi:hypothetical protein
MIGTDARNKEIWITIIPKGNIQHLNNVKAGRFFV